MKIEILRKKIKELEDKLINNLVINSVEQKLDIKPIKEEMDNLTELAQKKSLDPHNFWYERT
jgi:hypothetical protein